MTECPPAVVNKYRWYSKRASPYRESRQEMNAMWRKLRKTERFELRRLLWRRYVLAQSLFYKAVAKAILN